MPGRRNRRALVTMALLLTLAAPTSFAGESALEGDLRRVAELQSKGDFETAIDVARSLVESHPESLSAHLAYQDLHLAQGDGGKIRAFYLARTKGGATTANDHFLYARLQSSDRRAAPAYRKALKLDPEHFWSRCALGDIESRAGRLDRAAEHFTRAHAARADSAIPLNGLGWIAERRSEFDAAEKHYRKAMEADDTDILSPTNLGLLLLGLDRADEAKEVLEAAREKAPRDGMVVLALGMIEAVAGNTEGALALYEEASKLPGHSIESLNLLAATYTELEQYDLARGVLDRAINEAPGNEATRFNLAYLELAQDNADDALRWVKKILDDDSKSAAAHFLAGVCHETKNDAKEAERSYRRAIDLDDEEPSYHQALAALAGVREDWRLAVKHHKKAVELTSGDPDALLDLAFAYVGAGDARSAAKTFEDVIAKRSDDLVALMNLGLICQTELRDRDRAISAFEAYLTKGGKDPRVRTWLDELR